MRAARSTLDPERLPFGDGAFDLIASPLALHWVNDLPGALIQLRRALKPDGLLLASLFGGDTLQELRFALIETESELSGGAGPRVAPFADLRDLGGLLQRAGFALPAADRDLITVRYGEPMRLLADLRAMGETAALTERSPRALSRRVLARAFEIYRHRCSRRRWPRARHLRNPHRHRLGPARKPAKAAQARQRESAAGRRAERRKNKMPAKRPEVSSDLRRKWAG